MADIEFQRVVKRYPDGHDAVKDMNLRIADGEFMILVGPSGCGKSTALRMVAGLEEVTSGRLRIGGNDVSDLEPRRRDVAMVFQNYALYPHMTVRENMGFALRLRRADKAEIAQRVERAAALLDLGKHLHRKPGQLSGGQRQRVAMGRAIVREPSVFLMDEPLSNLDAKLRVDMRVAIARLQARLGTTTVYVTHDQTEATTLGDRVAVMRDGELQQVSAPAELYASPVNLFVASFIGSPPMNLIHGELSGGLVLTPLGPLPLEPSVRARLAGSRIRGREVVVGIRPEDFSDRGPAAGGDVPHGVVEAPVELTELAGPELYAYFAVGEGRAIARLSASSAVQGGRRHRLAVDTAKLHLFDPVDGRNLTATAG